MTVEAELSQEPLVERAAPRGAAGQGPWVRAGRKLLRDRAAVIAGIGFLVIVLMCLLAPLYATQIAKNDPFRSNLSGKILVEARMLDKAHPETAQPVQPTQPTTDSAAPKV